jgi:hypothetical protein
MTALLCSFQKKTDLPHRRQHLQQFSVLSLASSAVFSFDCNSSSKHLRNVTTPYR